MSARPERARTTLHRTRAEDANTMPATEKQIEANRANARKSTGPKTEDGKARSRANSLKHGMAGAGIVLPEEDRERWEYRAETWAGELGATTDVDRFLVERAATASVRLDACVRDETASRVEARDAALARWQAAREARARVEAHAGLLPTDPAAALGGLMGTVLGCEWLIGRWEDLDATLRERGAWTPADLLLAIHLLGLVGIADHPELWRTHLARVAATVELEPAEAKLLVLAFCETLPPPGLDPEAYRALALPLLPNPDAALAELRRHCDRERARLEALRDALWDAVDGPSRQGALDRVAVDVTERGMLRRRYESAATSELHRAVNQIHANRRALAAFARQTKPIASGGTGGLPTSGRASRMEGTGGQATSATPTAAFSRETKPIAAQEGPCETKPIPSGELVGQAPPTPRETKPIPPVEAAAPLRNEPNFATEAPANTEVSAKVDPTAVGAPARIDTVATVVRNEPNPAAFNPPATAPERTLGVAA